MSGTGKQHEWDRQLGSKLGSQMSQMCHRRNLNWVQLRLKDDQTQEREKLTGVLFSVDADPLNCAASEYHVSA